MTATPSLLAAIEWADVVANWKTMTPADQNRLIIVGALAVVTLLIFIWAVFIRKPGRRSRSHSHTHHHSRPQCDTADGDASVLLKRRKWRRQRRPHHPRNPTLAETGGLPPIRRGEPPQGSP